MIYNHKELLRSLKQLKRDYGAVGIKSSFEDEGVIFNELIRLRELCIRANMKFTMKIGGCEAISDINNCLLLNVDGIVAPMVESPFALEKFISSIHDNLTPQHRKIINFFINVESKVAYENIKNILDSESCRYLNGIVLGRSDLTKSFGLTKDNVNDDEIYNIVTDVLSEAKRYKLTTMMGGNISISSTDFIKKLYTKNLLDKIETRNIMFKLNRKNVDVLEEAVEAALSFESLWLRTKSSYYMTIGNSYLNRAGVLDERR
tara:strand:- start:76 stop:858 length:783 start_codon:yes stop_codon:yes gene_type:complete